MSGAANVFARILPGRAPPFVAATPVQAHDGFFRRAYVSGEKQVEITVARTGGEPGAYDKWVAASQSYPQVALPLPDGEANGFFTCASDRNDAACDMHLQLRQGFHVEVMGNGRVPRADLEAMLAHLSLAELAAPGFAGP